MVRENLPIQVAHMNDQFLGNVSLTELQKWAVKPNVFILYMM